MPPATCGHAIDVPEIVAMRLPGHAERMETPGAYTSTQSPLFAQEGAESVSVVAETLIASGALAGDVSQASIPSFPAAVTTTTPALVASWTAAFIDGEYPVPTDIEATDGCEWDA